MAQDYWWCPTTTEAVLPGIVGLLPQGAAHDAAAAPGTVQNMFWSAVASFVAGIETRLCAFRNELYCKSVAESFDQWKADLAIGTSADTCDAYGHNVCAKFTSPGGQTAAYFEETLAAIGWVIACTDLYPHNATLPISGASRSGCCQAGPTSVPIAGTDCGLPCAYGPACDYPDKAVLAAGSPRAGLVCGVPGSALGQNTMCCNYAGYFGVPNVTAAQTLFATNACEPQSVFYFSVPTQTTTLAPKCSATDRSGTCLPYTGYSFMVRVDLDMQASLALQEQLGYPSGGNALSSVPAFCALNTIKPAHIQIIPVTNAIDAKATPSEIALTQFEQDPIVTLNANGVLNLASVTAGAPP